MTVDKRGTQFATLELKEEFINVPVKALQSLIDRRSHLLYL